MDKIFQHQTAAFDIRDFGRLKQAVKHDETGRLVAKQVAGLFIEIMLKNMRSASFKNGLFDSEAASMFTAMQDQQIAQQVANHGQLGLANAIAAQLSTGPQIVIEPPKSEGVLFNTAMGHDRAKKPSTLPMRIEGALHLNPLSTGEDTHHHVGRFISRILMPSVNAGRKSGIPHQLIMAQAALESGWGKHEILTAQGKPTHNLFAIKATANWQGESTEIITTEFINGLPQKVKASFKVYPSYTAAFNDYINLLLHNPRYKKIVSSPSAELAAEALQFSGYATDPHYSEKLINVIRKIKGHFFQTIDAYKKEALPLF